MVSEKLKGGDILDHQIRDLIVREINDVKSKLDGLARKDLLAAIAYLEEGLGMFFDVLHSKTPPSPNVEAKTFCLALTLRNLELDDLDEASKAMLSNAKKRFDDARRKATEAFSDEALKLPDRIAAMGYWILATILETIENPGAAMPVCRSNIEALNSLPAVQNCFHVALQKRFVGRFRKDDRREVILSVCRLNRMLYDLTFMVYGFGNKEISGLAERWPCIGTECKDLKVNPLTDERVAKILQKNGMKHCTLKWSFGQEDDEEHKLKDPWGIATNTRGHFIIADNKDRKVKVYSSSGNFLSSFSPVTDKCQKVDLIHDVATDKNNNIYVLVTQRKPGAGADEEQSYVYMKTSNRMIPLKEDFRSWSWTWSSLTVTEKDKITVRGGLVNGGQAIDMYTTDGQFVRRFGERSLEVSSSVAAANQGSVIAGMGGYDAFSVLAFSKKGTHQGQFKIDRCFHYPQATFHQASGHVVVAGIHIERGKDNRLEIVVYTKEGKFVRSIQHEEEDIVYLRGITVTNEGRIALVYSNKIGFKVLVT